MATTELAEESPARAVWVWAPSGLPFILYSTQVPWATNQAATLSEVSDADYSTT